MELDLFKHDLPRFISPNGPPTFSLEESLPSLPVPQLSETLDLYLSSVRPFVTNAEFAATQTAVREFASGVGPQLHAKLLERASRERNWLADWWLHFAYLTNRTALHPLLNMSGVGSYHRQYWPPREGSAVERAAAMCSYYAALWKSLRHQTFTVDKNSAGKPFSMDQLRRFFSTCQLPGREFDSLACYFRPRPEGSTPRHFVVVCGGRQFVLDLVDATSEEPFPVAEYYSQLSRVVRASQEPPIDAATSPASAITGLLGLARNEWSDAREHLASLSKANRDNLATIDQATFVLSFLPDAFGDDNTRLLRLATAGELCDLWADKSCNLLVTRDGVWLNNCGHTPVDGMALVSSNIYADVTIYQNQGRIPGLHDPTRPNPVDAQPPPPLKELRYSVDARLTADALRGLAVHAAQCASLDFLSHEHPAFGKSELRRLKLHPDTAVQLALQLAYWRAHNGRPAPTYETASTRQFYHGRTETIRSCTTEAVAMCRAVEAWAATLPSSGDRESLQAAAAAAVFAAHARHNELRTRCEAARGCDRHLLGMQILAAESGLKVPSLYTDPGYAKSGGGGNFILSTSHLGYFTSVGCVAPMCKNGYGVFYRIGPAKIVFNLTRWTADSETCLARLSAGLDSGLADIRQLVAASTTAAAGTAGNSTAKL